MKAVAKKISFYVFLIFWVTNTFAQDGDGEGPPPPPPGEPKILPIDDYIGVLVLMALIIGYFAIRTYQKKETL